jgi:hypothetical protein
MRRPRRLALAALVAVACLAPDAAAAAPPTKVVKGPYVTNFSDTTADIRFELDAPGPAIVEIGRLGSATPPRKFADATVTANHLVHVTGLEASKSYSYGVTLGAQLIARGDVTAAPATNNGSSISFILYGDNRSDPAAHEAIVRAVDATPSQFLLNTGDIVEDGASASDWQSFFSIEAKLLRERPFLLCIGNHELYDDESGANFARYFGFPDATGVMKPYGSLRFGSTRFFFLNGMHDWDSGEERTWFERELTRADTESGLVWRVVVVHESPWSSGPHGPNKRLVSAHIPELLAAHKVDLLFGGHDHIYERGDTGGVKYMISGGGGAPLYRVTQPTAMSKKAEAAYHFIEVTMSQVDVKTVAHRLDGSILEKCGFLRGQPWNCDPVTGALALAPSASGAGSSAPAPASSVPAPTSSSRCSVATPGLAPRGGLAALGLAVASGLARLRRRRRG